MSEERAGALTRMNMGDGPLTDIYVQHAFDGEKYTCWGCGQVCSTREEFIEHFNGHIRAFFLAPMKIKGQR